MIGAEPVRAPDDVFRYEDGLVRTPLQIVERFARSTGQSWGHFEHAREEARRYMAYLKEGPADPELRSVWEANGWWLDRRPSRILLWNPRSKYHMRPRAWLWSLISDLAEKLDDAARHRLEAAEMDRGSMSTDGDRRSTTREGRT